MKKSSFLKLIQCAILCVLTFTIVPERIYAQEAVACMKDDDGNIIENFYSIPDAMNGSRRGAIHMLTDWDLGAQINIVEGTTSIIYMDGHTIKKSNGQKADGSEGGIFTLHPNSKLYLYGSTEETELTDSKGNKVTSGGLVTGGYAYTGGAIYMQESAKLYLTNVAISGNSSEYRGGGVYIEAHAEDCEIWMDNAHIDHNVANDYGGGGIYSNADGTHIHMKNKSTINYNKAYKTGSDGGGVAFNYSWFSLEGDGTCEISYNEVIPGDYGDGTTGGGIYAAEKKLASNYGIIKGLTIKGNYAGQGGGIEAHPRNLYLEDVTITENTAIIRGGGLFVMYNVDINLKGNVKIYNNHRTDSANDDIFLQSAFGQAYIINSGLSSDSLIGIRTETTGDRLVVKNISSTDLISCFFLNETSNYHIGYQSNDNELWQRPGQTSYAVKVNGQPAGKYVEGTLNVTVVDNNSKPSEIFVSWKKVDSIKGLSEDDWKSKTISFTMPANEVNLIGEYKYAATNLSLNVDKITEDKPLPAKATFNYTFDGKTNSKEVTLNWYKKVDGKYISCTGESASDGTVYIFEVCDDIVQDGIYVLSSAITKDNITVNYGGATIALSELSLNDEGTLSFRSNDIIVGKDKIVYIDPIIVSVKEGDSKQSVLSTINSKKPIATSYYDNSYELSLKTTDIGEFNIEGMFDGDTVKQGVKAYKTSIGVSTTNNNINLNGNETVSVVVMVLPKETGDSTLTAPVLQDGTSGKNDNGVLSQQIITDYATSDLKKYLLLNKDGNNNWDLLEYQNTTVEANKNTYKKVKAFAWVADSNNMSDVSSRIYTLDNSTSFSLDKSFISKINVTIDDIVYGQALPTTISKIDLLVSDDIAASYNNVSISSWTPSSDKVLNNTVYQAKAELDISNVDYLSGLDVVVNNNDKIYAYIEKENGKAILNIIFPELEGSKGGYDNDAPLSFTLSNIEIGDYTKEIAYEDALSINNDISKLDLPTVVLKTVNKDNEEEYLKADVTYSVVSYFDASNYDSQEIVLKGSIRQPSYMQFNGLSNNFTLKIKVKAKVGYVPEEVVNKVVTCEEYMKSKDWTWSESKKACVYKVSNTSSK